MKILIAEDNDSKYKRIKDCLEDSFNNVQITRFAHAKGVVIELETLDNLNQNECDLLIQDMQMPLNSDGRMDTKAGMYVLNQLDRRQIKIKTIVCSSDEVSFMNPYSYLNYPHFVKFEYGKSDWKIKLKNILKELK